MAVCQVGIASDGLPPYTRADEDSLVAETIEQERQASKIRPVGRYSIVAVAQGQQVAILDTKEGFVLFYPVPDSTACALGPLGSEAVFRDIQQDLFNALTLRVALGNRRAGYDSLPDTSYVRVQSRLENVRKSTRMVGW